jgi:threonyl-tRNA synthetase
MAESVKQAAEAVVDGVKSLAVSEKPKQQQQGVSKKKEKKANAGPAQSEELSPAAPYIQERLDLYDSLKAEYLEKIAQRPHDDITVTLPDGATRIGKAWETTPGDIARGIAKSVFENNFIARVDGVLWDFERVLEGSCKLEFLNFEDDEAKMVYWHSSAHVLGECSERRWGCDLCIGPPLEEGGFYYEMRLPDAGSVFEADWKPLENIAQKAIKEKQVFERLEVTKENLLKLFEYNKYKQHIIKDKIPDGTSTTIYRNGPFIDLCRGPHIPHTGRIKTFKIMKNSASYFLGDAANDSLQRIYGISFPDKNLMAEHLKYLEEAAKRVCSVSDVLD